MLSEHACCIVSRKDGGAKGAFRLKEDSVSASAAFNRCDSLCRVTIKEGKVREANGYACFFYASISSMFQRYCNEGGN